MAMRNLALNDNVATITGSHSDYSSVTITANCSQTQKVTVKIDNNPGTTYSNSGENSTFGDFDLPQDWEKIQMTFTFLKNGAEHRPSLKLEGRHKIRAEIGDDADFNDVVVELHK